MPDFSTPPSNLSTHNPPPPPAAFPDASAAHPPLPPSGPGQLPYQPVAPKQHRAVTVQLSPRNLLIGGSVLAALVLAIVAIFLFSGDSHPTPNVYSQGSFPGDGAGANASTSTSTDSNGNSVTMGPDARTTQNADGSTTTTDANGNTVTQGGGGSDGSQNGFANPQQAPSQNDGNYPQQQGYGQQGNGYGQQNSGYGQQGGGNGQQGNGYQQQGNGYGQQRNGYQQQAPPPQQNGYPPQYNPQ